MAKSTDFAQPILAYLREIVHDACPEVEETIKWGTPHFMYRGVLCSMAAFKQHCAFGFWKGSLILGGETNRGEEAMGHLGRITAIADLPSQEVLAGYVREAMRLNEEGIKVPNKSKSTARAELAVPDYLAAALQTNQSAAAAFDAFRAPVTNGSMWSGSRQPRARAPGSAGWTRPCSGWPRESHATGSTSNAEGWLDPTRIEPALVRSARD